MLDINQSFNKAFHESISICFHVQKGFLNRIHERIKCIIRLTSCRISEVIRPASYRLSVYNRRLSVIRFTSNIQKYWYNLATSNTNNLKMQSVEKMGVSKLLWFYEEFLSFLRRIDQLTDSGMVGYPLKLSMNCMKQGWGRGVH